MQELKREMEVMKKDAQVYRSLLLDVTGLASVLGIKGASNIQRQIALMYQLKAAYDAYLLARMASGDPLAWAGFAITTASALVNAADYAGMRG